MKALRYGDYNLALKPPTSKAQDGQQEQYCYELLRMFFLFVFF